MLITKLPVIVPPAFGNAAPAVVVVLVKTASRAAMSTPSTVPVTTILPETSTPVFLITSLSQLPFCLNVILSEVSAFKPTVALPAAFAKNKPLLLSSLNSLLSVIDPRVLLQAKIVPAPPIVIPAPWAAALSAASDAIVKFKSSIDTVVLLIVVVVPSRHGWE